MQSKSFNNPNDAIQYAKEKHDEGMVALAFQKTDGTAVVHWTKPTTYVAQDGQVYPDEIWITADGVIMNVSEMPEEHAKNALRLLLRQEREANEAIDVLTKKIVDAVASDEEYDDTMVGPCEEYEVPKQRPVTLNTLLDDTPPPPGTLLN